jgi:D-Tyr-tRNAtyr deacylase
MHIYIHRALPLFSITFSFTQHDRSITTSPAHSDHRSAPPALARELYDHFVSKVQAGYQAERVRDGVFQAMMDVALVNDGPVRIAVC